MIEPSDTSTSGLAGGYGHSIEDGKIAYQFQILRRMDASRLARWCVQLFSWIDGESTRVIVLDERDMLDSSKHVIYATADDMHESYADYLRRGCRL